MRANPTVNSNSISKQPPSLLVRIQLFLKQFFALDGWIAILWVINIASLVPRQHLLMNYETLAGLPPWMEPLAAPLAWVAIWTILASGWWMRIQLMQKIIPVTRLRILALVGLLPLLLNILRALFPNRIFGPTLFELLWVAAFAGLCAYSIWPKYDAERAARVRMKLSFHRSLIAASCIGCFVWWWYQSHDYYSRYLLGFNDFGHFTQRLASTIQGQGFLKESPVLPAYWDHFNPGLFLLLPLWRICPSVEMIFALQAFCLTISGWLIGRIVLALGAGRTMAATWVMIWLLHPSVSQMNLAYTYGWHPVSLAIPFLLLSALKSIKGQHSASLWSAIIACSFEETVIVIVGAVCLGRAIGLWMQERYPKSPWHAGPWESRISGKWKAGTWIWGWGLACIAFFLVYRFSGLAEFQTARFAKLGDSAWAILASPILRPDAFWGELVNDRSLVWIACLAIPLLPIAARSTWTIWIAGCVPLGVLLVWDHLPAKSLAFQYPATILPVWFVAAIVGTLRYQDGLRRYGLSYGALVASLILSMNLGQMPWSNPTLGDVVAKTYGPDGIESRGPLSAAGRWLEIQLDPIYRSRPTILATGRMAAHLVGCREVETVGQFAERRKALEQLVPGRPALLRYQYLILDRTEQFQQSTAETLQLLAEAESLGFQKKDDQYGIVILERSEK